MSPLRPCFFCYLRVMHLSNSDGRERQYHSIIQRDDSASQNTVHTSKVNIISPCSPELIH